MGHHAFGVDSENGRKRKHLKSMTYHIIQSLAELLFDIITDNNVGGVSFVMGLSNLI